MKTIVGLFDHFSEAEATVRELERAGYDRDDISMVASESARASSRTTSSDGDTGAAEGAGTGAVIGGVAGGAAGLIASLAGLAIPGIGPILAAGPLVATLTGAGVGAVAGGLIGALTTAGVPEEHARYYEEGVRRGGTLVTVSASDADADEVMDIMNRHNPVDIEDRASQWSGAGATTAAGSSGRAMAASTETGEWRDTGYPGSTGSSGITARPTAGTGQTAATSSGSFAGATASAGTPASAGAAKTQNLQGEKAIPVVEEELKVGKREVERGGIRVYSRMEEKPVEEQVTLREERVNVERRAVDRPATAGDFNQAFKEGTIEVTERVEQPVVEKQARVVEEVVVGKDATERTETVRDTVKKTDVQVEQVGAATGASAGNFDRFETDYRSNFQQSFPGGEYTYDQVKPVYRYGHSLADEYKGKDWNSVETDARRRWEERNPGTWDKFKNAARYAWDRARDRVS
jgi:uncharacterized protein (TIGR02271 family)